MNDKFGILSTGAYIPRRRLHRSVIHQANSWFAPNLRGLSKGEKSIANWDEDSITMAVDAGRDCLATYGASDVEVLSLSSTTLPYADRLNSGIVKEAMNLSDNCAALDVTGSLRAGTSTLIQAFKSEDTHLCLAAELRKTRPGSEGEMLQGEASAAILLGKGTPIATLRGSHSVTIDFVDHFRASKEDFDYHWEKRWVRDSGFLGFFKDGIAEALKKFGVKAQDIDHVIIPLPGKTLPRGLDKALGVRPESVVDTHHMDIGFTGTAHPLLMLAATLEKAKPGEMILLTSFGQGADILLLETTDAIGKNQPEMGFHGHLATRADDQNYMRFLFHRGLLDMDKGMRAEYDEKQPGTSLFRERKSVLGLIGGKCSKTGTIQFPKTNISVSQNDRAVNTQEDYPLSNKHAKITTYTADSLAYSPDPPTYYGMIDFEGGGRMISEFSDVTEDDVEVGREMRMVFRIKAQDEQRKFTKYFWKATPVRTFDS